MRKLEEKIFKALMIGATTLIIAILLYIFYVILRKGLPSMNWDMVTRIPTGGFYLGKEGGILNAIMGSLYLILFSVLISLIIRILTIYIFVFRKTLRCFSAK